MAKGYWVAVKASFFVLGLVEGCVCTAEALGRMDGFLFLSFFPPSHHVI